MKNTSFANFNWVESAERRFCECVFDIVLTTHFIEQTNWPKIRPTLPTMSINSLFPLSFKKIVLITCNPSFGDSSTVDKQLSSRTRAGATYKGDTRYKFDTRQVPATLQYPIKCQSLKPGRVQMLTQIQTSKRPWFRFRVGPHFPQLGCHTNTFCQNMSLKLTLCLSKGRLRQTRWHFAFCVCERERAKTSAIRIWFPHLVRQKHWTVSDESRWSLCQTSEKSRKLMWARSAELEKRWHNKWAAYRMCQQKFGMHNRQFHHVINWQTSHTLSVDVYLD